MGKNQFVVPKDGQWAVKGEGNEKATRVVPTQKEAIKIAKEISKNQKSEMLIQKRNGQFRERNTYGKDPYPPEG